MSMVRKSLEVFTSNWLQYPFGLAANVIVIRSIGAEGKGVSVLLMSAIAILATLGHLGTPSAAIYYLRKRIYSEQKLIANFMVLVLIYSLCVLVLFLLGSRWFCRVFFRRLFPLHLLPRFFIVSITLTFGFIPSLQVEAF